MVLRLRKTLSDVHGRVKRLSELLDGKPKQRRASFMIEDSKKDINDNIPQGFRRGTVHYGKPSVNKKERVRRRLTVTGCDGQQVVRTDKSWYYNDFTETTIDQHGVKETSFCSSHL